MEQAKQLLEVASRIIKELELLSKSKETLHKRVKKMLLARLLEISENLVELFPVDEEVMYREERAKRKQDTLDLVKHIKSYSGTLRDIRKKIKYRKKGDSSIKTTEIKKSYYIILSNILFHNISHKIASQNKYLSLMLRKANINLLADSFVAVVIMNTLIAFFTGLLIAFGLSFLDIKFIPLPLIVTSPFNFQKFLLYAFTLPILSSLLVFLLSYYYPYLESISRANKIDDEIPFAAMHMAAVVSSGVEPTRVFRLISEAPEYKEFSVDTKRIVNKINLYGYDLLTALKDVAKLTPSEKAKDLFNGMVSIIASGGDISEYLEKKASSLLLDYKLERKRFIEAANLYADLYTGVLITAPIILGVLLALISPLGGNILGAEPSTIAILGLIFMVIVNILFISILKMIQPSE